MLFRSLFAFNGDAERLQEVHILRRECLIPLLILCVRWFQSGHRLQFNLIQPNRRFQHQKNVESLLANVLNNAGNIFGFRNALVNGFAQLLDQLAEFLIQGVAPFPPLRSKPRGAFGRILLPYF